MEIAAKVTSKGQITIPKSVREALSLETGDTVVFRVRRGRATMARTPALLELAGSIEVPAEVRGMAWSEIVERTHRAVADDFEP